MIICSCNGLSDRDVQAAIQAGVVRLSDIYAARQCRVKCGNCVKGVACLLKAARETRCPCPTTLELEEQMAAQAVGDEELVTKKRLPYREASFIEVINNSD